MPRTALQLPPSRRPATRAGRRLFRKQILPAGTLDVRGRKVEFTPAILRELIDTFRDGAMTQVPFVLANERNEHNDDPERFRGEVQALEADDLGLHALVETTDRGAELLRDNPKLPVSVRAFPPEQGLAGGRWVLGHVCGTLDEVAKGMGPWAAVEASEGVEVLDLSGGVFVPSAGGSSSVNAMGTEAQTATDGPEITPTMRERFLRLLGLGPDSEAASAPAGEPVTSTTPADTPVATEPAASAANGNAANQVPSDEEVDRVLGELLGADPEPASPEPNTPAADNDSLEAGGTEPAPSEREPVAASRTDTAAIELANGRISTLEAALNTERADRARERFAAEADGYLNDGVPPAMVELSRPILERPDGGAIELSNGQSHDAAKTVRDMLDAARGTVELTERGADVTDAERSERDKLHTAWDAMDGEPEPRSEGKD